jgi:hypothetical protein
MEVRDMPSTLEAWYATIEVSVLKTRTRTRDPILCNIDSSIDRPLKDDVWKYTYSSMSVPTRTSQKMTISWCLLDDMDDEK